MKKKKTNRSNVITHTHTHTQNMFKKIILRPSASQLQNHVYHTTRRDLIFLQSLFVGHLLASENETNLIDLNALSFLQCILDLGNLGRGFKVERLLATSQSLDLFILLAVDMETLRRGIYPVRGNLLEL